MNIRIAESDAELARISDVLLELRGSVTKAAHFSIADLAAAKRT